MTCPPFIGPYEIVRRLGEGGIGEVYLAIRHQPVYQLVALKVIKPGMSSSAVLARFELEQQTLALMNHDHIARILDAGATPDGRPYFAMELVEGQAITPFCTEHALTLEARLELFASVCHAVQHAHTKGVVHRDIKPSNILVFESQGKHVSKLLDFGIAKVLLPQMPEITTEGQRLGTADYMSPEQARGQGIDTRSDIYSLGALLYELVAGTPPFDLGSATDHRIVEIISTAHPTPPSKRLGAKGSFWAGMDRRGLDFIVLKALRKEPESRYQTVDALLHDIQRVLVGESPARRTPEHFYRFKRALRRNRVPLVTSTLILTAFVSGLVASRVSLRREIADREAAFDAAVQMASKRAAEDQRKLIQQLQAEIARLNGTGDAGTADDPP
jgi:serine/threonine protein kinase